MKRILILLTLICLPTTAFADGKAICAHLSEHATDYKAEDAEACESEIVTFLEELGPEQQEKLTACVISHKPISQEQFGECLMGLMGSEGDPEGSTLPDEAEIAKLCAHLETHAEDFDEEDAAECPEGMASVGAIIGKEAFTSLSTCLLAVPKPGKDDLEKCMELAMPAMEEPSDEPSEPVEQAPSGP